MGRHAAKQGRPDLRHSGWILKRPRAGSQILVAGFGATARLKAHNFCRYGERKTVLFWLVMSYLTMKIEIDNDHIPAGEPARLPFDERGLPLVLESFLPAIFK
jgi:hypothetical protein